MIKITSWSRHVDQSWKTGEGKKGSRKWKNRVVGRERLKWERNKTEKKERVGKAWRSLLNVRTVLINSSLH